PLHDALPIYATPRRAELDTPRGDLVENRELELGLDLHALARRDELVVASERPDDRSSRCAAVEPLEPQPVREQVRNRRLQRIQPRQCVFANADQYVDAEPAAMEHARELLRELAATLVVEEALLELVEDQVQIAPRTIGGVRERIREIPPGSACRLDERRDRVPRPRREDDHLRLVLLPQPMRDAGAQH